MRIQFHEQFRGFPPLILRFVQEPVVVSVSTTRVRVTGVAAMNTWSPYFVSFMPTFRARRLLSRSLRRRWWWRCVRRKATRCQIDWRWWWRWVRRKSTRSRWRRRRRCLRFGRAFVIRWLFRHSPRRRLHCKVCQSSMQCCMYAMQRLKRSSDLRHGATTATEKGETKCKIARLSQNSYGIVRKMMNICEDDDDDDD